MGSSSGKIKLLEKRIHVLEEEKKYLKIKSIESNLYNHKLNESLEEKLSNLNNKHNLLERMRVLLEEKLEKSYKNLKETKENYSDLCKTMGKIKHNFSNLEKEKDNMTKRNKEIELQIENISNKHKHEVEKNTKLQSTFNKLQNKYKKLEEENNCFNLKNQNLSEENKDLRLVNDAQYKKLEYFKNIIETNESKKKREISFVKKSKSCESN